MKARAAALAAGLAAGLVSSSAATTITVTISGVAETEYDLDVSGIQKSGRLGGTPGPATARALFQVEGREAVTAKLTFTAPGGAVTSCPAVRVSVRDARPICEPAFTLTGRQTGSGTFACVSRCDALKSSPKASDEDEDQEWIYAGGPAPRLDGWARLPATGSHQSFYSGAMPGGGTAGIY